MVTEPSLKKRADHIYMQKKKNTCGPAALAFLFTLFGIDVSEDTISRYAGTNDKGTSMLGLSEAVKKMGFNAWGERQNYAALRKDKFPLIAYINNDHYITIMEIDGYYIYAFDPARGVIFMHKKTFLKMWNGYVLKVRPEPIPKVVESQ